MLLKELLSGMHIEAVHGRLDTEIDGVEWDFFSLRPNDLFIYPCRAINEKLRIAEKAIKKGAAAIITDGESACVSAEGATVIQVDTLDGLNNKLCLRFYGEYIRRMKLIGVTGTKGKTTTCYMISAMLQSAGYKVGVSTTIGTWTGKRYYSSDEPHPHAYRLYREMAENGVDILVGEFSSGDMWREETDGLHFAASVYTNLYMDHVGDGEHPTFEHYRQMKAHMFRDCGTAVINGDDPRNEDPLAIIDDIRAAVEEVGGEYVVIPDRVEAIETVLADARRGDIILLAGKGHEGLQKTATETVRMSDRSIAEKYITDQGI